MKLANNIMQPKFFIEIRIFRGWILQGHQCPLPLGILYLQEAQSAPLQTSLLIGVEALLTSSAQVFH